MRSSCKDYVRKFPPPPHRDIGTKKMNPIYEKQVFYALNELYLDSVRLDPDLDFDWDDLDCRRRLRRFRARDYSPESISDMEVPGSVRVMELGKSLICCLVLDSRSQGLWQALQLSMFTEFGATGDLIVKARGGAYPLWETLWEGANWLDRLYV